MATLIPIKHPDGRIEKITLDEFRTRQKKSATPSAPMPAQKPTPTPTPTPAPIKIDEPAKQAPKPAPSPKPIEPKKPEIKISKPIASPSVKTNEKPALKSPISFDKEDAKSLLEDEMPKGSAGATAPNRLNDAREIAQKSNIKLNPETEKRLIGLIQLRLKDIRSEDEAREWMMMSENQLGIGLNKEQADKILKMIEEKRKKPFEINVPVLKKPLGTPTALAKEDREPLPAVDAPNNPFVHSPQSRPEPNRPVAQAKPIMQDITSAKSMNLGPVDEIKYFTLVDFRRLSANPMEAAARLKQKFINLKEESYLLFINALEVWRQSPLFIDYMNASVEALNTKTKLTERDKNEKITIDEIEALIKMEKDLL